MKQYTKAIYHSARVKTENILFAENVNPVTHGPVTTKILASVNRLSKDKAYAMHKHRLGDQISVLFHPKHISIVINEHQINVWLQNACARGKTQ